MVRAQRPEARRSGALAIVVAFLAVVLGVSQLGPGPSAGATPAAAAPAVARARVDVQRLREASAHSVARTETVTARLIDDLDVPAIDPRVRATMLRRAVRAVSGRCAPCVELLQTRSFSQRPVQDRGFWARKMIGLAP